MVAARHKLSRREVLAGACAAPALPRHPGLDPGSTFLVAGEKDRWMPDQARHDDGAAEAWARAVDRLACAETQIAALAHSEDQDAYDHAVDRQIAALARLMAAPAPDLPAAAWKLDLFERHMVWELDFREDAFAALRTDLHRLAS